MKNHGIHLPYDRAVTWQADQTNRFIGGESTGDPTPVSVAVFTVTEQALIDALIAAAVRELSASSTSQAA